MIEVPVKKSKSCCTECWVWTIPRAHQTLSITISSTASVYLQQRKKLNCFKVWCPKVCAPFVSYMCQSWRSPLTRSGRWAHPTLSVYRLALIVRGSGEFITTPKPTIVRLIGIVDCLKWSIKYERNDFGLWSKAQRALTMYFSQDYKFYDYDSRDCLTSLCSARISSCSFPH